MLDASLLDQRFNLPLWMLLDNVEDKGMVEERSWNFQRLHAAMSEAARVPHQIIFTTSKIAPELDRPELVVGRRYERAARRSEEHTSELQSLMRISYAVFCLKKKKKNKTQ